MAEERSIPDWQLERYLLGEIPAAEAATVREVLAGDQRARERVAWLERSNAEILERHPPREMVPGIRHRAAREGSPLERGTRPLVRRPALAAAVGAVAVAIGLTFLTARRVAEPPAEGTRVKGLAPHLVLYREVGPAQAEPLAPGALARYHDVVQIAYQAAGRRYGAIVSIDGRGVVTRHLPATGSRAAELRPGGPMPLPAAYELDDAPAFERFFLVAADEPFDVETVVAAVRRTAAGAGRLDLPPALDQSSFVLRKEPAR
jgi:hypothetical protein